MEGISLFMQRLPYHIFCFTVTSDLRICYNVITKKKLYCTCKWH